MSNTTIKGKINILVGKENNEYQYKVLLPETVTRQITDFESATNTLIDTKLADYTTTSNLAANYLGINATADAATVLETARNITISDSDSSHTGEVTTFDGSQNIDIKLPSTITADLNGNALTATRLASARTLKISDSDGTNIGEGVTFNGTSLVTLKLPDTAKLNIAGSATSATNDSAGNSIVSTYATKAEAITNLSVDGSTITFTKGDSSTDTIHIVDTTYTTGTTSTSGITKLYTELGTNTDGALTQNASKALLDAKQPLHASLTSISELTTSANQMIYTTAANTYGTTTLTEFARSILDDTTAEAVRTTIGAVSADDNVATATALETVRSLQTNLSSNTAASFDGSADANIGVTGTLSVANGGTGQTSIDDIQAGKDSAGNTITSYYMPKVKVTSASLTTSGWTIDPNEGTEYIYKYVINDANVTATDVVNVNILRSSVAAADAAYLCEVCESGDGTITLHAKTQPNAIIAVEYSIYKGTN